MLKHWFCFLCIFLLVIPCSFAQTSSPLVYALPSSYTRYQRQQEPWFLDCAVDQKCIVHFEVCAPDEQRPVVSIRKRIDNSGFFRISWNGKNGDRRVAPGAYLCRVYANGCDEQAVCFSLDIREGKPEHLPVKPNGSLLPLSMQNEEIWRSMMQPITVVDIDAEAHQKIYEQPDPKSAVLGHVHGQSQGLEVLETGERYTRVRVWRHEDNQLIEGWLPTQKLKVVQPNTHYGLLIHKTTQTLTVYENGQPIGQARISTGLPTPEHPERETRTGAFITTDRLMSFESSGFWCEYPIRFDGGNLLHQAGCLRTRDGKDFTAQQEQLGRKASKGCVRVAAQGEEGFEIDAFWLWTHVEYGTKVIVMEGE